MLPGGGHDSIGGRLGRTEIKLEQYLQRSNTYEMNTDGLEATFNSVVIEDEPGMKRIDERGFVGFLTRSSVVLPEHFMHWVARSSEAYIIVRYSIPP